MFTTRCFIKNNTQELRDKLIEIGYSESAFYCGDLSNLCVNVLGNGEYDEANDYAPLLCNAIDCWENEDLFIAIAALRDDSDNYQLFFHNKDIECEYPIECIHDKFHFIQVDEYLSKYKDRKNEYHKATVEELIKHFK